MCGLWVVSEVCMISLQYTYMEESVLEPRGLVSCNVVGRGLGHVLQRSIYDVCAIYVQGSIGPGVIPWSSRASPWPYKANGRRAWTVGGARSFSEG